MKKNLTILFPDIFGEKVASMENWKAHDILLSNAKNDWLVARNAALEEMQSKILEKTIDPILKNILLQKVVVPMRRRSENEARVIQEILLWHMNDNKSDGYEDAIVGSQIHRVEIFDGVEELFEKKFYIPEINAEIWFTPRPQDNENVILYVGEIEEVLA